MDYICIIFGADNWSLFPFRACMHTHTCAQSHRCSCPLLATTMWVMKSKYMCMVRESCHVAIVYRLLWMSMDQRAMVLCTLRLKKRHAHLSRKSMECCWMARKCEYAGFLELQNRSSFASVFSENRYIVVSLWLIFGSWNMLQFCGYV